MMGNVTIQNEKQCENESLNYDKISLKLHGEQEVLKKNTFSLLSDEKDTSHIKAGQNSRDKRDRCERHCSRTRMRGILSISKEIRGGIPHEQAATVVLFFLFCAIYYTVGQRRT
jgi:hypothetical protein